MTVGPEQVSSPWYAPIHWAKASAKEATSKCSSTAWLYISLVLHTCDRQCSKYLVYINFLDSLKSLMRFSRHRWGNWETERLSSMPMVTQLGTGGAGIWIHQLHQFTPDRTFVLTYYTSILPPPPSQWASQKPVCGLFFCFLFWFGFGCAWGMWKFPGLCHSSDSTRSLACCITRELLWFILLIPSP